MGYLNTMEEVNKKLERKNLSKKIRFEVLKRDMFKCQYCGRSPIKDQDVVLEVDHIIPVAEGGNNEMINLVTSCWDCNRGKGARKLDDRQIIVTQHEEIEKLQIENEQYDHLIEYKKELMNIENKKLEIIRLTIDDKLSVLNRTIGETYLNTKMKKLVRKYGVPKMIEAIEQSYNDSIAKYDRITDEEGICNKFLSLIENYFNYKEVDPIKKKISYIFGIARNTFSYINNKQFYIMTNELIKQFKTIYGDDEESLMIYLAEVEELLKNRDIKNWTQWKSYIGTTSEEIIYNLKMRKTSRDIIIAENLINNHIDNKKMIEVVGNLSFDSELEFIFGDLDRFVYKENCINLYLNTLNIGIDEDVTLEKVNISLNWHLENVDVYINKIEEGKEKEYVTVIDINLVLDGNKKQSVSFTLIS